MGIMQDRSQRKPSGGMNKGSRPKRLHMAGDVPSLTVIGELRVKHKSTKGGSSKKALLAVDTVNLYNPKTKKYSKAKIKMVKESASNRNYVRRNIMTKGTVIETEKGLARITSRPGQEGSISAILI